MSAIKTQQELLQMVGALQRAGYNHGYADAHPMNSHIQQEKTDAASRSAQKALSTAIEALQSRIAELTAETEALRKERDALQSLYGKVVVVTMGHAEISGVACVHASTLGDILSQFDKEWWRTHASPVMKVFRVSETDWWFAEDAESAKVDYKEQTGEDVDPDYFAELTDAELDQEFPETDEDERRTGAMTTFRKELQGALPGPAASSEY